MRDRALQRLERRRLQVGELEVGHEPGDVPRGERAELGRDPAGDGAQLVLGVVDGWDDVRHTLDVHAVHVFRPNGLLADGLGVSHVAQPARPIPPRSP